MLTILTGDKGSSGDALIVDRGIKLLEHFFPGEEILKLDRWKPIDEHLEKVNEGRAAILLGGPAYERDIYPGVYPLVSDLDQIKVPILSMGLGASLLPYNETAVRKYQFTQSSKPLLDRLHKDYKWVGVRDYITKRILHQNGIDNAAVIGCPAWYNLDTLGKPVVVSKIKTVAFAPGVRHLYYRSRASFDQQVEIMTILRNCFPDALKYCVFQDSLEQDETKPLWMRQIQRNLANESEQLGYKVVDCTNNLVNMVETYEKTDFLISYRVHAHICMLSMSKLSVLIAEDSRGYGMNDFIGLKGYNSFIESKGLLDSLYLDGLSACIMRRVSPFRPNPNLPLQIEELLTRELDSNFAKYAGIKDVIISYFQSMERFIMDIPRG